MVLLASGCADSTANKPAAAANSYSGPLHVRAAAEEHPKAGAAGDVVDCQSWGYGEVHSTVPYGEGATADSPEQALSVARSEGAFAILPDLQVAKTEHDRVLYVLDVHGMTKQAAIVHNGPATDGAGGRDWYLESSAM